MINGTHVKYQQFFVIKQHVYGLIMQDAIHKNEEQQHCMLQQMSFNSTTNSVYFQKTSISLLYFIHSNTRNNEHVEQSNLVLIFEAALLQGQWLMAQMVMVLVL